MLPIFEINAGLTAVVLSVYTNYYTQMPSIISKLLSFLKRHRVFLKYVLPVILIFTATIVKLLIFSSFGYKVPYVLFFISIVVCWIYADYKAGIIAFLAAIAFSFAIYLLPSIYPAVASTSYQVLTAFLVTALLLLLIVTYCSGMNRIRKEKEEQFLFLADAVPEKIWMADQNGKATYYNHEWYDYTGYKTFEELHKHIWSLIHPDDLELVTAAYRKHLAEGTPYEMDIRLLNADEVYRWHLNRTKPKRDSEGNITLWIGTCIDIHDQKLIAESVRESERHSIELLKKMDEFISIASHELKTPMASIQGYLQIMERIVQKNDDPAHIDFISKAKRQLSKLSALTQDLLDVSKIQEGKIQFNFTDFVIGELIEEAIEATRNNYPSHRIDVKGSLNVVITADRFRLEQVLCNLLSNAVKYSPEADKVVIEVSIANGQLQISVIDFGIGIPEKNKQYIFDRFYRVEDMSYKFTGLGIGLYICSEIIKRHEGKIWFTTEQGKGSTFSFSIPAKKH